MPEPCWHYIVLIPPFILYGPCKLKSSMYYFAPNSLVPPWFYMSWSFETIYSLQCLGLSHFAFVFIASTDLCSYAFPAILQFSPSQAFSLSSCLLLLPSFLSPACSSPLSVANCRPHHIAISASAICPTRFAHP